MFELPLPPTTLENFVADTRVVERNGLRWLQHSGAVVVVGANGAGKSRYGAWLDIQPNLPSLTYRISAARILQIPEAVHYQRATDAEAQFLQLQNSAFLQQNNQPTPEMYRNNRHRHNIFDAINVQASEFQYVLSLLMAKSLHADADYAEASRQGEVATVAPPTLIHKVQNVWKRILPERELVLNRNTYRITANRTNNPNSYQANWLSDGEKVILYLIASCLMVPRGTIIIVDEPEIHLHRSIQIALWNEIEFERPDCQFVYLTHDQNFAALRQDTPKVWFRDFDGTNWNWRLLPQTSNIALPEDLLLTLIGSRQPILFVEGSESSIDKLLYQIAYPDYLVIPQNGCGTVINSTIAFRSLHQLHSLECYGIIDRDRRTNEEISSLVRKGVYTLEMAEVENLLLHPNILRWSARHHHLSEAETNALVIAVQNHVINSLNHDIETLALQRAVRKIDQSLDEFGRKPHGEIGELTNNWNQLIGLNPNDILNSERVYLQGIIDTNDYISAIQTYSNKGLIAFLAAQLALRNRDAFFMDLRRLLTNTIARDEIKNILENILPVLP